MDPYAFQLKRNEMKRVGLVYFHWSHGFSICHAEKPNTNRDIHDLAILSCSLPTGRTIRMIPRNSPNRPTAVAGWSWMIHVWSKDSRFPTEFGKVWSTWTSGRSWWFLIYSWWFQLQPIWKLCSSKWVHLPQISGWKYKNFETTT